MAQITMNAPTKLLQDFEAALDRVAPSIINRLQPGMSIADIDDRIATFAWKLPEAAYNLYKWHNGLSGAPGKLNLVEKLLRLKGKWHGELSGRENEAHLQIGNRRLVTKFLPLDYALAGHRHLKLGRCPIDLLPMAISTDGTETFYCMMRLEPERPIVYVANGTNLPPLLVTESFLSTQPQFSSLSDLIVWLTSCCQQGIEPTSSSSDLGDRIDLHLDAVQIDRQVS
jgi:hypothetical protein